jgi:hypothetical protein
LLARSWFTYRKALKALDIDLTDCPQVCRWQKPRIDIRRNRLCEKCPRRLRRNEHKRATERLWEEWMPDESDGLEFEQIQDHLNAVLSFRDTSRKETPATIGRFLGVYREEEDRHERLEAELNKAS